MLTFYNASFLYDRTFLIRKMYVAYNVHSWQVAPSGFVFAAVLGTLSVVHALFRMWGRPS